MNTGKTMNSRSFYHVPGAEKEGFYICGASLGMGLDRAMAGTICSLGNKYIKRGTF